MKPDPQLVNEAEQIVEVSNSDLIHKCLIWYTHWCRMGNQRGMETSARVLRHELQKAHSQSERN